MRIISLRSYLCGRPPPTITEYFSYFRSPGSVFLVAEMFVCGLICFVIFTALLVLVAIPLICPRRFNETRSDNKIDFDNPFNFTI